MKEEFSLNMHKFLITLFYFSFSSQAFLQMCNLPVKVVCRANAEYMSPSGKWVCFLLILLFVI
jgi:hypothetical protein